MNTTRDYLKKALDSMHEHHRRMSEVHGAACDDDSASDHQRSFHKACAGHHAEMADCMKGMSEECMKATEIVDLAKVINDVAERSVKAEFTRAGVTPPPGNRLVVRAGDPEPVAAVEPQLVADIFG